MDAKKAKLLTLVAVVLASCVFYLKQSTSVQSTGSNCKKAKDRLTDVYRRVNSIDTASRRVPSDVTGKTHSSKLAGQPVSVSRPSPPDKATQARLKRAYGKLPLSFEANHGQTDARVKFLARGNGYNLFLS
jgi:hypothetical protein